MKEECFVYMSRIKIVIIIFVIICVLMLFIFLNRNRSDLKIDQPDGLCVGHFDKFCTGCCFFPAGNVRCPVAISTPGSHP